ncbi:hypothetical protein [Paracoccus versutus]|uniref:Uncharacterized protein n=1 Tax=Paracoccus versutus TaxID=34007 RepID=A0A3D9XHI2_PARVE|nr:hypothetical protein [Paracoccus versutus]REF69966.1 hypothetical protein BDD41_2685 [Paracoccus versutus]WGR57691.1 hypothetical protein E3U25_17150 [Paracoccus versutus]
MSIVPSVDNRISTGNLLLAGSMLVAVAVAWGNLSGRAADMASDITAVTAQSAANEARIRALETTAARQDERMVLILDSLRKIESRLERGPNP